MRTCWVSAALSLCACVPAGPSSDGPKKQSQPGDPNFPDGPKDPGACEDRTPITPRLRRLTFDQYDRTVSTLVGTPLTPSTELGPQVQGVTSVLWAGIQTAAAQIAAQTVQDPAALAALLSCDPSALDAGCAADFVQQFGRRAFRRPLSDDEQARYLALFNSRAELTESGAPLEGLQLMLEAFLQSPNLLLRVERAALADQQATDRILIQGYEMATRLAYGLWNSPPDVALLDAAERGDLDTPEGVRQQAERMLEEGSLNVRAMVRASHRSWLGMEGAYGHFWANTMRDPELYPSFYPGIDFEFREEVLRFVEHVVFEENGGFAELLTSPTAVVNDSVAPLYGLSGDYTEWTPVSLDPQTRPGLLTRAGFLGTHGRFSRGSLIFRGAFVLKRLLCREPGAPPAGAESTPLPQITEELRTTRDRVEAMTAAPACATCHQRLINPSGFAMEVFDGLGNHRVEENGVAIDTTGTMLLDDEERPYVGPTDFARMLSRSPWATECYVERFAQYAFSDATVAMGCDGEALAEQLRAPGSSIQGFLVDFVTSDAFRYRSTQEAL